MAERVCVPELRQHGATVPRQPDPPDVQRLQAPEHRDRGHHLRQDSYAIAGMVGGGLVSHQPEARGQRIGFAACAGPEQLPNSVDDVAPIQARYGAYRARTPQGFS